MTKKHTDISHKKKAKKILLWITLSLISVVLIVGMMLAILVEVGKKNLLNNDNASIVVPENVVDYQEDDGKTISYKGQNYTLNENITSILLIGVDKEKIASNPSEKFGANGQADLLLLVALDTTNGNMKAIPISRDTMIDVNQYSISGQYIGIQKEQICLSYSYGDGREKSCENTVTSVSRLLYGMPVNSYVAIDIEGIKVLNDALGGVNVTVTEDTNLYGMKIKKGQSATLKGEYALGYIRSRDQDSIEANSERMARQKNYMKSFFKTAIQKTKKDITTPVKLYNKATDYTITDITVADVSFLTKCVLLSGKTDLEFASIKGQNVMGEKYIEFYPDRDSLYDVVVNTFYNPVNNKKEK